MGAETDDDAVGGDAPPRTKAADSWRDVVSPSLAFAGTQACWAVQIGHTSAELRKLGLRDELIGIAWLAGPITGAIVQPIVGVWSDRCTSRLGKRRPFMLGGAIGMLAGLLLFSNSANIAGRLGDPVRPQGGGSKTALAIAIASFWIIDTFTNTLQGPARTLLGDVAPASSLSAGNAYMAAANGIGKMIGYAAGSFTTRIEVTYGVTGAIALLLTLVTVFTVDEERGRAAGKCSNPGQADDGGESGGAAAATGGQSGHLSLRELLRMPPAVAKAFAVQCFAYFAFMLLFVYGATWVGQDVFGGAAEAAPLSGEHLKFVAGVQLANQGFLLMAAISVVVALVLPASLRAFGVRAVWSFSLFVFGACLLATTRVRSHGVVYVIFALLAVPLATSFTIPWAIASIALRAERGTDLGRDMAMFNLSQSLPGVVAALVGGLAVWAGGGNLSIVLATGGVAATLGAVGVWWTDVPAELGSG